MTSRERIYAALNLELPAGERIPRHLWWLPWAEENHPGTVPSIQKEFPDDICNAPGFQMIPVNANAFGSIHNTDEHRNDWVRYGPLGFRSEGKDWAYEYQLKPMGILTAPLCFIINGKEK